MAETIMGSSPRRQWAISPVTDRLSVGKIPFMNSEPVQEWQTRLEQAMRELGLTMKSLSLKAGLGETFVRDALKRGRKPSIENFKKLAAELSMPVSFLMGEDVPELVYVPLPEDEKWSATPDHPGSNVYSREAYRATIVGALPEIDVRAGAGEGAIGEILSLPLGNGSVSGHRIIDEWVFPEPFLRREAHASPTQTIVMAVVGDSMSPTYMPGDRVLVDLTQNELMADTVYVISDGVSPPQIKRLQRVMFSEPVLVRIISDNPALETDTVELTRLKIIGRVCGHVARK
jgi:transcriptional regulator with XRE-family HTH domain